MTRSKIAIIAITSSTCMIPPAEKTKNPSTQPMSKMTAIRYNIVVSFNFQESLYKPTNHNTQICASVATYEQFSGLKQANFYYRGITSPFSLTPYQ